MYVLSKDVTITRRLGPSAPIFFAKRSMLRFVLSKDVCVVKGVMFCRRNYVLSTDVTITRRLGPSAPIFFKRSMLRVVLSKDVCFVKGVMLCRRIYVLSKDVCFVEGFL